MHPCHHGRRSRSSYDQLTPLTLQPQPWPRSGRAWARVSVWTGVGARPPYSPPRLPPGSRAPPPSRPGCGLEPGPLCSVGPRASPHTACRQRSSEGPVLDEAGQGCPCGNPLVQRLYYSLSNPCWPVNRQVWSPKVLLDTRSSSIFVLSVIVHLMLPNNTLPGFSTVADSIKLPEYGRSTYLRSYQGEACRGCPDSAI